MTIRKSILALSVSFLLLGVVLANVVGQENPSEREGEPNLFGKVFDSGNREPVHAVITLHGGPEESWMVTVETDREGAFKVHVRPGRVLIEVSAGGYQDKRDELLVPDDRPLEIGIPLDPANDVPEPNVFGMMVGEEGMPVSGIISFHIGDRTAARVETGRNGNFELFLEPGVYSWHAESRGYTPARGEVEVPEDEPVRLMLMFEREDGDIQFGSLSGIVTDTEGSPVGGARIIAFPMDRPVMGDLPEERTCCDPMGMEPPGTISERDGSFRMRLPLGAYFVRVLAEGFEPFETRAALTPERPDVRIAVELPWMENREPKRVKIHMEYVDEDSDGKPEKIIVIADTGDDDIPDLTLEMTDRDSDGNFESILFDLNAPMKELIFLLSMIMEKMGYMGGEVPPFPEGDWPDDEYPPYPDEDWADDEYPPYYPDEPNSPGERERIGGKRGENMDGNDRGDVGSSDGERDVKNSSDVKDSSSSSKDSRSGADSILPEVVAASAVIMLLIAGVFIAGYVIRRRRY